MINEKIEKYINDDTSSIVTPVSNISMVFEENNLAHAMLILKESNYTQIPVLNYDKKFTGLISFHHIYKKLGEKLFDNFDNFDNYYVKDFIDTHNAIVKEDFKLEDVLNLLINYNFINVVSDDGKLVGMITRSSVLKKMNHLSHNIDKILY
ncbi:cyclic-di-AMP-binding protein CbpB [Helcococcus kunzii]|uniref:CBS domain-containing protein n=1 Tax=Helcococcus kunzii ATCC 51366 TaxID=883114 RepID=H3NL48_9FIRM|nr:cyclic-di-AMP-binding protein CbpB [Helcococcus kunzii]EHR36304.1 hypothetical protein HMPREF9709_00059 [Helcococcus kunzii ATCC 51366]MCT1796548.1 CBS domain-containing protein [Helcococcus kunzii]MCT1989627.1 CBS domain-containing protein [Helcococcus kunzii]QUY63995.1 CBS domain-containing protein [Helcococcus kunzii]QZO76463.1 CBS domain-containing protein [Helcococcus kunzii]